MFGAFTIGERSFVESGSWEGPSKSLVREGSPGDVEEEAVAPLGGSKRLLLRVALPCDTGALEDTLEGAAVEEEAVAALDGTEPKSDPPLDEEAMAPLAGAKTLNRREVSKKAVVGTGIGLGRAVSRSDPPSEGT